MTRTLRGLSSTGAHDDTRQEWCQIKGDVANGSDEKGSVMADGDERAERGTWGGAEAEEAAQKLLLSGLVLTAA